MFNKSQNVFIKMIYILLCNHRINYILRKQKIYKYVSNILNNITYLIINNLIKIIQIIYKLFYNINNNKKSIYIKFKNSIYYCTNVSILCI